MAVIEAHETPQVPVTESDASNVIYGNYPSSKVEKFSPDLPIQPFDSLIHHYDELLSGTVPKNKKIFKLLKFLRITE